MIDLIDSDENSLIVNQTRTNISFERTIPLWEIKYLLKGRTAMIFSLLLNRRETMIDVNLCPRDR